MGSSWCKTMEKGYSVRRAGEGDLASILAIYAGAREFMARSGNPNQWGKTNPPREVLLRDIELGQLYVLTREGVIHGVFAFLTGKDPTYSTIYHGSWRSAAPYGTIHRVAGDGSGGIFAAAVDFCLNRYRHLRVDTHADNLPMQRAILRAGFSRRGIIYIADGSPRIAYDRIDKETADIG